MSSPSGAQRVSAKCGEKAARRGAHGVQKVRSAAPRRETSIPLSASVIGKAKPRYEISSFCSMISTVEARQKSSAETTPAQSARSCRSEHDGQTRRPRLRRFATPQQHAPSSATAETTSHGQFRRSPFSKARHASCPSPLNSSGETGARVSTPSAWHRLMRPVCIWFQLPSHSWYTTASGVG